VIEARAGASPPRSPAHIPLHTSAASTIGCVRQVELRVDEETGPACVAHVTDSVTWTGVLAGSWRSAPWSLSVAPSSWSRTGRSAWASPAAKDRRSPSPDPWDGRDLTDSRGLEVARPTYAGEMERRRQAAEQASAEALREAAGQRSEGFARSLEDRRQRVAEAREAMRRELRTRRGEPQRRTGSAGRRGLQGRLWRTAAWEAPLLA
jgi:hypothetical protein